MANVKLEHVYKVYDGNITAADDVNVEILDREFVVLVGPSGCGKSTILRMIAGLEDITKGTISIDGKVVNSVPPKDRDIAMVFQNYALYPHMSVRENMAFGLKLRKFAKSEIEARVGEAAEILQLQTYLDRKPKALSGGQRQRVALGRAIVRKPKVFLFDEPLSNLDAKLRNHMRAEIMELHQRLDATIIYVTHDQIEAMTMGSKIVVMKDGLVQQTAAPIDLYNKPVNLFVAEFIGSPTMNFFGGNVQNGEFVGEGLRFSLKGVMKDEFSSESLTIGIRPENVRWGPAEGGFGKLSGVVELAEPLGAETYLHIRVGQKRAIIKVAPDVPYSLGEQAVFNFNPEQVHMFDTETQNTLT
ncbi:MAG TPA: sn-glycerol-3-phosphate ABC transporter ATP-binding protein UgpC, partial [Bacteroidetes bacterium]|nr:sn-glycerol-3-phosphate ABC transporter ATP-binding protein UgpC [Bacteroidota bacterium]HEX04330.1 sn-glycerol-3-phosphate ABC transporter ATP-binding protein UgpC [Bacteroidota bacterium]